MAAWTLFMGVWWSVYRTLLTILTCQGDGRRNSYAQYIAALKIDPNFAPAFTSLGIYYLDVSSPPDPVRASKCFQKAFELDAREGEAAKRLAEGFAEAREWDLVEIVAKRAIEGEGGLEGGNYGASQNMAQRLLPINAWAWKAVGVAELVRRLCLCAPSVDCLCADAAQLLSVHSCLPDCSSS